ncbi:hypothetical protein [Chryseobacterium proteolyticum]|uniref:hypothetical protein n=1 Tax=Chryseobacterium proteolyticum TaxID=118127 RepID=UPI0039838D07
MAAKDYLDVKKDDSDKRKQIVSLSPKALRLMPEFEMLWNSCEAAIIKVLQEDLTILKYLDTIEASLEETSFYYRFKQEYKNQLK